jgi:probable phosphoglycerate mutase
VANWSLKQFLNEWPDFYQDTQRCYPGGESHQQLNERVLAWLEWASDEHAGQNILAVCHSGPIACLVQHALGIPMTRFPALLPTHASLTVIQYTKNSLGITNGQLKVFSATDIEVIASIGKGPL